MLCNDLALIHGTNHQRPSGHRFFGGQGPKATTGQHHMCGEIRIRTSKNGAPSTWNILELAILTRKRPEATGSWHRSAPPGQGCQAVPRCGRAGAHTSAAGWSKLRMETQFTLGRHTVSKGNGPGSRPWNGRCPKFSFEILDTDCSPNLPL